MRRASSWNMCLRFHAAFPFQRTLIKRERDARERERERECEQHKLKACGTKRSKVIKGGRQRAFTFWAVDTKYSWKKKKNASFRVAAVGVASAICCLLQFLVEFHSRHTLVWQSDRGRERRGLRQEVGGGGVRLSTSRRFGDNTKEETRRRQVGSASCESSLIIWHCCGQKGFRGRGKRGVLSP